MNRLIVINMKVATLNGGVQDIVIRLLNCPLCYTEYGGLFLYCCRTFGAFFKLYSIKAVLVVV